jgi:predicted ATP-grasp superfamily ATP-dependent carboligase
VDSLQWIERPTLRRPVLVVAFEGWNDAGDGASTAVSYLARRWNATEFATIDPEEFYDFTSTRPHVRLDDSASRVLEWPQVTFSMARMDGDRDVVFLSGIEPQLRWRTFCSTVIDVARGTGVELAIVLGALLAEVPHTRPVRITGTAADRTLVDRLGLRVSRYEGPTGILGVMSDAFAKAGIPTASLWAAVPAYVGQTPSPKATLALVSRLSEILDLHVPTVDLDVAAAAYERQVSEVVAADEDALAYVRSLEEVEDAPDEELELDEADSESLVDEVERYLRDQSE